MSNRDDARPVIDNPDEETTRRAENKKRVKSYAIPCQSEKIHRYPRVFPRQLAHACDGTEGNSGGTKA